MAASDDNFISEIFLNGCFSKTAAKIYLLLYVFTVTLVKVERVFMDFR